MSTRGAEAFDRGDGGVLVPPQARQGALALEAAALPGNRQPSASAALRAAEAAWRATVQDHGTEETAPRIAAWRRLEALRAKEGA